MHVMDELAADVSQNFPVLEAWYIDRMLGLSLQPQADVCQLLLAASHFGVISYGVSRALEKLESVLDPPETQHGNIVSSCLRQVVLMHYDLACGERRRWFAYWIDDGNLSGEGIVTVAYIVNLAAESQQLLSATSIDYISNWHVRHSDIRAPKFRAWALRALVLCGHRSLARARAEELLSEREKNGSWQGGYSNTAAMAYALLHSGVVTPEELVGTMKYLIRRLQRGVTADVALESTTLKVLQVANLLTPMQESSLVRSINKDRSVFLSHSSSDHPFVRHLGRVLAEHGVRVWVDEAEITGGDSFIDKIEEGLSDMQHLVIVLSSNSVNSFWVKRELNFALVDKVEGNKGKVIPILLEACEIPPLLRERHYVDFRVDFESGVMGLLKAIGVEPANNKIQPTQ